jgi:hypothetical protein
MATDPVDKPPKAAGGIEPERRKEIMKMLQMT